MNAFAMACAGLVLVTLAACAGPPPARETGSSPLDSVPPATWAAVARTKIFFGHQSVGYNIVEGLQEIQATKPDIRLNIQETRDPQAFQDGVFAHAKLGKNRDVGTKCESFDRALRDGLGDKVDIAFFKFCYVDVEQGADTRRLFDQYAATIEEARRRYPRVMIVPMTVPLTAVPTGPRERLKTLFKRGASDFQDNRNRHELNRLIVDRYGPSGQLFDLARFESTDPDGRPVTVERDGVAVPAMFPAYTEDGGHLNAAGRRIVATNLLLLLAKLTERAL